MVLYSRNDTIICLTFMANLKDMVSDWFYSLLPHSLYNFKEITETFSTSTPLAGRPRRKTITSSL